jgi:hypothetical protein
VLLIFNRPDLTRQVFDEIRRAEPPRLFVVADGPRPDKPDEGARCQAARAVVDQVDWPCEVARNYSATNLGLRERISSGLTWVFEQVEEAIILEDDCLPHPSFFRYTADLLERYRHDTRVMSVCGSNYQQGHWRGPGSYYFSKYVDCWGWATWRRAWRHFDLSMSLWPVFRDSGALRHVCPDQVEHDYWHGTFEAMYAGAINSWAYAWVFAAFLQHGLNPHPNRNLVTNLGFRSDATHTFVHTPYAELPTSEFGELTHPPFIVPDRDADLFEFDLTHGGAGLRRNRTVRARARRLLGRMKRTLLTPLQGLLARQPQREPARASKE